MNNTDNSIKTSNSKITEALELLNEAAKEKRHEMKELMTDRYAHIKQAVLEGATQGRRSWIKPNTLLRKRLLKVEKQ